MKQSRAEPYKSDILDCFAYARNVSVYIDPKTDLSDAVNLHNKELESALFKYIDVIKIYSSELSLKDHQIDNIFNMIGYLRKCENDSAELKNNPVFLAVLLPLMYLVIEKTTNWSDCGVGSFYEKDIDTEYDLFPAVSETAFQAGILSAPLMNSIVTHIFKKRKDQCSVNKSKVNANKNVPTLITFFHENAELIKPAIIAHLRFQGVNDNGQFDGFDAKELYTIFSSLCKKAGDAPTDFVCQSGLIDSINQQMSQKQYDTIEKQRNLCSTLFKPLKAKARLASGRNDAHQHNKPIKKARANSIVTDTQEHDFSIIDLYHAQERINSICNLIEQLLLPLFEDSQSLRKLQQAVKALRDDKDISYVDKLIKKLMDFKKSLSMFSDKQEEDTYIQEIGLFNVLQEKLEEDRESIYAFNEAEQQMQQTVSSELLMHSIFNSNLSIDHPILASFIPGSTALHR